MRSDEGGDWEPEWVAEQLRRYVDDCDCEAAAALLREGNGSLAELTEEETVAINRHLLPRGLEIVHEDPSGSRWEVFRIGEVEWPDEDTRPDNVTTQELLDEWRRRLGAAA